jgi:putative addiction module killer protein
MVEIRKTEIFERWFVGLRDRKAVACIKSRIDRLQLGLYGDVKPVREGVSEMRINFGPGYRIYFAKRGKEIILLLAGGDKHTQQRDIEKALELARML